MADATQYLSPSGTLTIGYSYPNMYVSIVCLFERLKRKHSHYFDVRWPRTAMVQEPRRGGSILARHLP